MSRLHLFLFAAAVSLALPLAAQQTCNLQINVSCKTGSNTSCTSTTLNAGSSVCSGEYLVGYYITGTGQVSGLSSSLGLGECFDSSLFPQPGIAYAVCMGPASLGPGASVTAIRTLTAICKPILAFEVRPRFLRFTTLM